VRVLVTVGAITVWPLVVTAAEPSPLTPEETALATRLAKEMSRAKMVQLVADNLATPDKRYVVSVQPAASSKKGGEERLAVVTEFQYLKRGPGLTLRTTVDVKAGKAVKQDVLENYPTPLAPEERAEAVKLARTGIPRAHAL
jgi:hypothetical protein